MADRLLAALVTPCTQSSQPAIRRLLDDVLKGDVAGDPEISTSMKVGLLEGSALMLRCRAKDSRLNVLRATVSLMQGQPGNLKIEFEAPCEGIAVEGHLPPYPQSFIGRRVLLSTAVGFRLYGVVETRQTIQIISETRPEDGKPHGNTPEPEDSAEFLKSVQFVALSRTWKNVQFVSPLWGGQILRLTNPIT